MASSSPEHERVLQSLPGGVLVLDSDGSVVLANTYVSELLGQDAADLVGMQVSALAIGVTPSGERDRGTHPWWEWAEGAVTRQWTWVQNADGQRVPVYLSARRDDTLVYVNLLDISHLTEWAVPAETDTAGERERFHGLVGRTPQMQRMYELIEMAADTDVNVVVQGESGTGKELAAAAIHQSSARRDHALVRVNCAALTESLLESELFGHVKGAFTGAFRDREGTFEAANGGTILLDEIGEISPAMQAKLLRVLQERVIVRVGDTRERAVDVRVVAATNKNLRQLVSRKRFREDLFFRLNVFPIQVPPLNERHADIPLLVGWFLQKHSRKTGKQIRSVSSDAMRILLGYCWPGNVRELENVIEHAFVLCRTAEIQVDDLPYEMRVSAVREGICAERIAHVDGTQEFHPAPVEKRRGRKRLSISAEQILAEIKRHGGNKSAAARALGISKVGLWKKMKKMGL